MQKVVDTIIDEKLNKLLDAFCQILYDDDTTFMENMKESNLAGDDIAKYRYWEWTQGVGLFGIWKLFEYEKKECYIDILKKYYDRQLKIGFPALNVNTVTPFLTMSLLGEYIKDDTYLKPCRECAQWIMEHFPRTQEGGFQHMTSDTLNDQELWDDTLFMTVLFLANMGRIEKKQEYIEEAQYQFMVHIKYLLDKKTGLLYHGWTFIERNNFAEAFWGRGNCWITIAIPEFLHLIDCPDSIKRMLTETLEQQVKSLKAYQNPNGMWHTLVDDQSSYVEASATCGFAYGILKAVHMGIIDAEYEETAYKALNPIIELISDNGVLNQVSYGTPMGRKTKDFYKQIEIKPMPYGQALAILFLLECKK